MKKIKISGLLVLIISIFTMTAPVHAATTTVSLGAADDFVILSGTPNITDVGNLSVIAGYVGLSPESGAGIGLLCSQVNGAIYSVDGTGPAPCQITDASLLTTAKNNLTAAYLDAAGRTPVTNVPTELGGTTLVAGVYDSTSTTFEITAGAGALVLDGQGDAASVFIFKMAADGTGLTVGSGSVVSLANNAQACNVFWQVDTATIDTTAVFKGNVLALNSITVANGANIVGRLLARNGNVTLINDTITIAPCVGASAGGISGGPIPSLPNTASDNGGQSNNLWHIVPIVGLVILLSFLVSRQKRTD